MPWMPVIIVILVTSASPVVAATLEDLEEVATTRVVFRALHDPCRIVLELPDGRVVDAHHVSGDFDRLAAIEPPREAPETERPVLRLAWTAQRGLRLVGAPLEEPVPLVGVVEPHPIDLAVERLRQAAPDTPALVSVQVAATAAWEAELARVHQRLGGDDEALLVDAQRAWEAYRDAQHAFIDHTYARRDGTIWRIVAARRKAELVRSRVRCLAAMEAW